MALDLGNSFVRETLENLEQQALDQLTAEDFRDWRLLIRSANTLPECREITSRMLGLPLNDSERRIADEVLTMLELEADWKHRHRNQAHEGNAHLSSHGALLVQPRQLDLALVVVDPPAEREWFGSGYHISLHRLAEQQLALGPATADSRKEELLAVWQCSYGGLAWIDALANQQLALELETGGYPSLYTAQARDLLTVIESGPPQAREVWCHGSDDVLLESWPGTTTIHLERLRDCHPCEWLLLEAWDES